MKKSLFSAVCIVLLCLVCIGACASSSLSPGMYRVGADILPGLYKLTAATGKSGYWKRSKNATGEFDAIIANDLFENTSYVSVDRGEYLTLSRCYGILVESAITSTPRLTPSPKPTASPTPIPLPPSGQFGDAIVWHTLRGRFYHADERCPGMTGAKQYTIRSSVEDGFKPCTRCKPPALEETLNSGDAPQRLIELGWMAEGATDQEKIDAIAAFQNAAVETGIFPDIVVNGTLDSATIACLMSPDAPSAF